MFDPNRHKYDFLRSQPIKATREKIVYTINKDDDGGPRLQPRVETVTETVYDVTFPLGYTVRLNERELKRYGLDRPPRIVDTVTGDVMQGVDQ